LDAIGTAKLDLTRPDLDLRLITISIEDDESLMRSKLNRNQ